MEKSFIVLSTTLALVAFIFIGTPITTSVAEDQKNTGSQVTISTSETSTSDSFVGRWGGKLKIVSLAFAPRKANEVSVVVRNISGNVAAGFIHITGEQRYHNQDLPFEGTISKAGELETLNSKASNFLLFELTRNGDTIVSGWVHGVARSDIEDMKRIK